MKYPEAYGKFQRFYLEWSTRRAVKNCAMILPTEAVAKDLELFGAENVKVIHHGPLALEKCENRTSFEKLKFLKMRMCSFYLGRIERKRT